MSSIVLEYFDNQYPHYLNVVWEKEPNLAYYQETTTANLSNLSVR